jgi:hypothetical protein
VTAAHAWGKLGAQRLVLIGAMLLLAIGSAGVPWAYHVGRVTGDFEYWVMMFEMILVGQAAVTILHLWQQRTATVTRQGA